jgi:rfaE bifunctional protein kinase chain/domain
LGDVLIVTVTDDNYVNKGPGRPVQNAVSRAEILSSLKMVDHVAISKFPTALEVIDLIKPDVYVKGPDYVDGDADITGNIAREKSAIESYGGKIHFTSAPAMSSSKLINDAGLGVSNDLSNYLNKIRKLYSETELQKIINDFEKLKVLVIGEAIIDEYLTCEALGKSSKDPVLAFREVSLERQIGGGLAIANHCANLGARVTILTKIGNSQHDSELVKLKLNSTITPKIIVSQYDPTIIKRRFVDSLTQFRVFETYVMAENKNDDVDLEKQINEYKNIYKDFDLVLICDYGHGLMAPMFIETIVNSSAKLSINTQSNAGNRGLNSISKYARVDFLSLNGSEVGMELRSHNSQMNSLLPNLLSKTGAKRVLVTEGAKGLSVAESLQISHAPALADKVIDRVGAGDAVFATASLLFALDADLEITGFLSNLAGAIAISDLGNRKTVDSVHLAKYALSLIK